MYTLIAENEARQQLRLTGNKSYDILDVSGTNPAAAVINTTDIVGVDGSRLNSTRIGNRNIVITLKINPPIEQNRLNLYRYFRTKRYIKLWYKNSSRSVYIEGYVETFENNPWTQLQEPQISIICPNPFWMSEKETSVDFSNSVALFEFPFSIPSTGIEFSRYQTNASATVNAGEIETGGIITFHALDAVANPKFYNSTTQQFFGLQFSMISGDIIVINTQKGEKSVRLVRGGVASNLMQYRESGSEWISFVPGENLVSYEATSGATDLRCRVSLVQKFEGV